jgi:hypothetical protein
MKILICIDNVSSDDFPYELIEKYTNYEIEWDCPVFIKENQQIRLGDFVNDPELENIYFSVGEIDWIKVDNKIFPRLWLNEV